MGSFRIVRCTNWPAARSLENIATYQVLRTNLARSAWLGPPSGDVLTAGVDSIGLGASIVASSVAVFATILSWANDGATVKFRNDTHQINSSAWAPYQIP